MSVTPLGWYLLCAHCSTQRALCVALKQKEGELKSAESSSTGATQLELEIEELKSARTTLEATVKSATEAKDTAAADAEAQGSLVARMACDSNAKTQAIDMIDKVLKDQMRPLLERNDGRFYLKSLGEVNADSMRIVMCPRQCMSCKVCLLYLASTQFQEGLWTTKEAAKDPFDEARQHNGIPPFVAECVFKKRIVYADGGDVSFEYDIREEDETTSEARKFPLPDGRWVNTRIQTLYPADFVKYLRKYHREKADRILAHLKDAYVEWLGASDKAGYTGYSVVKTPWNRKRDQEMTPAEKVQFVLEHCALAPQDGNEHEVLWSHKYKS